MIQQPRQPHHSTSTFIYESPVRLVSLISDCSLPATVAQTNELLYKILRHNLCCLIQSTYELGIEPTFWND
jgi:hypothetical protein